MACSDFSALDLTKQFGVKFKAETFFTDSQMITPSSLLFEALNRGQELGFGSEKSRSERLAKPILLELSSLNRHEFSIYSGMNLDIVEAAGLRGECDFIFSFSRIQDFVTVPIFCIAEAKKQDLGQGTIQAAAQLLGAKKLNQLEGNSFETLCACVTTGIEWRFLQLNANTITIDEERYLISRLPGLLGVLQTIISLAKAQVN